MTGPDDNSSTRPISVAELLARNGTIGAPPVGGRRRRRRGNADAVTVAELTGEIPVVGADESESDTDDAGSPPETATAPEASTAPEAPTAPEAAPSAEAPSAPASAEPVEATGNGEVALAPSETDSATRSEVGAAAESPTADATETTDATETVAGQGESDDDYADAVAEYSARVEQRAGELDSAPEAEPEKAAPGRRFGFGRPRRQDADADAVDAEQMRPDPLESPAPVEVDADTLLEAAAEAETVESDDLAATEGSTAEPSADDSVDGDGLPSYLRSSPEPLFGGQTVADDLARRGSPPELGLDFDDSEGSDLAAADGDLGEAKQRSSLATGLWIIGQSVLAVVFGAGLFIAFDQLWKWNNIVALVLSVLVILGLVVGVRVVRKTEDIGSTLIAVAVGALVTLGPLALLQSG